MTRTIVQRRIAASRERVFRAVSELRALPEVVPDIVAIEILHDPGTQVGTRFRETRSMKGKTADTELEVTEYVQDERVRMVADSHGTVWDTVFRVRDSDGASELEIVMDARAHGFLPKLMNPLLKGLIRKGIEKHADAVQAYCEQR